MQTATTEVLDWLVKTSMEDDDWDEPTVLLILQADGNYGIAPLLGAPVPDMLAAMGPALKERVDEVAGLILVTEGWGLSAKVSETESMEKLQADIAELRRTGRSYADHPGAVEFKMFTAVDAEGMEYRHFERGQKGVEVEKPQSAAGRVPSLLKALFEELTKP